MQFDPNSPKSVSKSTQPHKFFERFLDNNLIVLSAELQDRYSKIEQAKIVGVLVLLETEEGFCIETIAVRPDAQGLGVGGTLMAYAEQMASQFGYTSLYLSTHRLMRESQAVYAHLGYVEFDQRMVNGYDRIFVRKLIR